MTRVAVTTTPDAAPRLSDAVVAVGLEPVQLPCIRIEVSSDDVLDRLRDAAGEADLMVLTSRRPVSILWPANDMPPVPVASVGAATAAAVRRAGGTVALSGTGGATDLISAILPELSGKRVVFPHARASDPSTSQMISRVAAELVAEAAYETKPIGPDPAPAVDAALFGSPSAVDGWCTTRRLDDLIVGAMGSITADALAAAGHPATVTPTRPGFEELATALARHLDDERSKR